MCCLKNVRRVLFFNFPTLHFCGGLLSFQLADLTYVLAAFLYINVEIFTYVWAMGLYALTGAASLMHEVGVIGARASLLLLAGLWLLTFPWT